METESLQNADM